MRRAGIVFDLDGTLADTLGDIGGAMNFVLAARGLPVHPAEVYKTLIGEGVEISSLWLATLISLLSAVVIFRTV